MTNKTNENNSRRKLLKTAAASSGLAVAATALPVTWTKPVVDSILLPAHAQTSGAVVGGVYTAATVGITFKSNSNKTGVQYALLDSLISPVNAQVVFDGQKPDSHIVRGLCGNNDDEGGEGNVDGTVVLIFRVNANDIVDVAVTLESGAKDDSETNCAGATTIISGVTIQDVTVQLDDDEFIALTNMVANATEITGDWSTVYDGVDDSTNCGATFTAPLSGAFPVTIDCGSEQPN